MLRSHTILDPILDMDDLPSSSSKIRAKENINRSSREPGEYQEIIMSNRSPAPSPSQLPTNSVSEKKERKVLRRGEGPLSYLLKI